MKKKHGELKIMTAKELVDTFILGDAQEGMDYAVLEFTKKELNGIPAKYLDVEKVYEDAWGWNGIRVMESPLDTEETIIVIGHYGSMISDCMAINAENLTYDCYGITERIHNAIYNCGSEELQDDTLLIVEMHDAMYKRVEEDAKCERSLTDAEFKRLKELQKEAQAKAKAKEDAREWKYVTTYYYADNSEEELWRDKDGNEKMVMTVGAHGDACY